MAPCNLPGLDDIAAIYSSAILACCLVVGSPLDSNHVLGARLSGTGVLERNIFKASLEDGANLTLLLHNNNDGSGNCPVVDTCGVVPLGVDTGAAAPPGVWSAAILPVNCSTCSSSSIISSLGVGLSSMCSGSS